MKGIDEREVEQREVALYAKTRPEIYVKSVVSSKPGNETEVATLR